MYLLLYSAPHDLAVAASVPNTPIVIIIHFRIQILKEFYMASRVRREINSTDIFSDKVTIKSKPDGTFSFVFQG